MDDNIMSDEPVSIGDRFRRYTGYALLWFGNWLFVRWGTWLLQFDTPTTTPALFRALIVSEQVDRYGIDGLAAIKGFHDAYLRDDPDD